MILYAIYKSGFHKGNERGINGRDAIINYIKRNNSKTEKDLISYNNFVSVVEKATGLNLKEIIDL